MTYVHPLANGLSTDHPVPGLPFVDDSHIPLDEGPEAIEAVGRHQGDGMWGRYDTSRGSGGWLAFTTDPLDHSLGWSVRYHPDHGRTVLLLRDDDTSSLHSQWDGDQLLLRAGGYWWDGTTWYRPGQVWDPVAQDYERRKARAAVTITAADMLDTRADPAKAAISKVGGFDPAAPAPDNWADHLALWAACRQDRDDARPLDRCVVDVTSPELTGAQLIGVPEMAELGGITASTLRAYISRGNSDVPSRRPWSAAETSGHGPSPTTGWRHAGGPTTASRPRCPPATATTSPTGPPKSATTSPPTSTVGCGTGRTSGSGGSCAPATKNPSAKSPTPSRGTSRSAWTASCPPTS
ncbi:hypothetical protein [Streptomyces sp. QHH-9511]|uniref:hypothetical protein n=1 Tax=Streptomyces sp. QHH-9511 TaxID=2684468 RepID=UPI001E53123A|nr:hypothetical protein [Streptomyces sp. QHH-9511]